MVSVARISTLIAYRLAGRFNDRGQVADAMKLLRFVERLKQLSFDMTNS